jgi:hypothetical protein
VALHNVRRSSMFSGGDAIARTPVQRRPPGQSQSPTPSMSMSPSSAELELEQEQESWSTLDGESARQFVVSVAQGPGQAGKEMVLLLGSRSLVIAHASQVPIRQDSVCTRINLGDVIGADVNAATAAAASQRGETANLFRLRIWRADASSVSGRSEGSVVLTAVDPPTPAAFLHALAAMQAL